MKIYLVILERTIDWEGTETWVLRAYKDEMNAKIYIGQAQKEIKKARNLSKGCTRCGYRDTERKFGHTEWFKKLGYPETYNNFVFLIKEMSII